MKRPSEQSLTKLADAAFRQAARDVLALAERTGTRVVVLEDGEMKQLQVKGGKLQKPSKPRKRRC